MRHSGFLFGLMALLFGLDQASKYWVRLAMPNCDYTRCDHSNLIPWLIDLTHVENPGVSFGFLGGLENSLRVPLLVGISLAALAAIGFYWWRQRREMNFLEDLAFVMILAGAFGNLVDRSIPPHDVTDFLRFRFGGFVLFTNNLADIFISLGVVAYLGGMWRGRHRTV